MTYLFVKSTHRWFLSALGRRRLDAMLTAGLPPFLQAPLLFLLTNKINREDQEIIDTIEAFRAALARRADVEVTVYDSPPPRADGTGRPLPLNLVPGPVRRAPLPYIAGTTSVLPYWGAFLRLCANARQAKTILELGGCAGISGCYLASGNACKRFITIEGSSELATLAETHLHKIADHTVVMNCLFERGLDEVLPALTERLDVVHIDGHHEKSATLHYVQRLIPHLSADCVLLFDDIRWTSDMWETWKTLCEWEGVRCTVDVGRYGICIWGGRTAHSQHYDLSKFTDLWRWGKPSN